MAIDPNRTNTPAGNCPSQDANVSQGNSLEQRVAAIGLEAVESVAELEGITIDPNHLGSAVIASAGNGNKEIVRLLLEGKEILPNPSGPAIIAAAKNGHKEIVQWLLEEREIPPYDLEFAVLAAAGNGYTQIVQLLLSKGATIGANHLKPIVIAAAEKGQIEIIQWLLKERKIDSYDLGSAIIASAGNGHKEIVRLLLDGREIHRHDLGSAVIAAAGNGHKEIVQLLLKERTIEPKHLGSAVIAAAGNGHKEIIQWLLEAKIIGPKHLEDAIIAAARNGQKEMVQWFLDERIIDSFYLELAVKAAAGNGNIGMIQWFLDERIIDSRDSGDAVEAAAEKGHIQIVQLLLSKGTTIDIFHLKPIVTAAAEKGYTQIVQLLLEGRTIEPKYLGPAVIFAARNGHTQTVQLLLSKGTTIDVDHLKPVVIAASEKGFTQIVQLLLEGRTIDSKDLKPVVIAAAKNGHKEIVQWLLNERKIDSKDLEPAVLAAAGNGQKEMVQWLLDKSTIDSKDLEPAVLAAAGNGHIGMVQWLLEGRTVNPEHLLSAVVTAARKGHIGMVRWFLDERIIDLLSEYREHREILFELIQQVIRNTRSEADIEHQKHNNVISVLSNLLFSENICSPINNIVNYKNESVRNFLISSFLKLNLADFDKLFTKESSWTRSHNFTPEQINNIQLLILAVESLSINPSIKESMFEALKLNYKSFKWDKMQHALLQFMQVINVNSNHDKHYEKTVFILRQKTDLLKMIQLCQLIIKNNSRTFLNLGEADLNSQKLSEILLKEIEQFCPSEDERQRCLNAIMDLRDPGGVFVYISNFLNAEKPMKLAIQKLFKGILNPNQFIIDRNTESPHWNRISSLDVKKNWTTPLAPVEDVTIEDSKVKIDIRAFLIEKLITDGHANGNFKNLIEMIQTEKEPSEPMTDLENQIYQLIDIKEDQLVTELASILEKMKTENLTRIEFYHDIQGLIQQLNSKLSSIKKFTLVDSDDIQDLLYCGTEVDGSCQRLDGSPDLNRCLMGYVLDGKIRLLAVKNEDGRVVSRVIIKLLFNDKDEPVCFFERVYGRGEFSKKLLEYAHEKAKQLNVPLYTAGGVTKLASIGNAAPYEYEDGGVGVSDGVYTIDGQLA